MAVAVEEDDLVEDAGEEDAVVGGVPIKQRSNTRSHNNCWPTLTIQCMVKKHHQAH